MLVKKGPRERDRGVAGGERGGHGPRFTLATKDPFVPLGPVPWRTLEREHFSRTVGRGSLHFADANAISAPLSRRVAQSSRCAPGSGNSVRPGRVKSLARRGQRKQRPGTKRRVSFQCFSPARDPPRPALNIFIRLSGRCVRGNWMVRAARSKVVSTLVAIVNAARNRLLSFGLRSIVTSLESRNRG